MAPKFHCQSLHLRVQTPHFFNHKINVYNRVKVQGPVKQTIADKLRNKRPKNGNKKTLG